MSDHKTIQLGVNVDHIATLREVRGVNYPDPMTAAEIARKAGADGVTIQDHDVYSIKGNVGLPMNLEMAATQEMLKIASTVKPFECCLVPEKRAELTTEGGLDVITQLAMLTDYVEQLQAQKIKASLFIDPEPAQIEASKAVGADIVELHTGRYADIAEAEQAEELERLYVGAKLADSLGMQVNAGHGLHYRNVDAIAAIPEIVCLNIGHSIVSRASMTGMYEAVFNMKNLMIKARLAAEEKI